MQSLAQVLGHRLREHRHATGLGTFEVAERAGVPARALLSVERGEWRSLELFFRLCRAAQVRYETLVRPPAPSLRAVAQGRRRGGVPYARSLGPDTRKLQRAVFEG